MLSVRQLKWVVAGVLRPRPSGRNGRHMHLAGQQARRREGSSTSGSP